MACGEALAPRPGRRGGGAALLFVVVAACGGPLLALGDRNGKHSQFASLTVGADGKLDAGGRKRQRPGHRGRSGSFVEIVNVSLASDREEPKEFVHEATSWAHAEQIWEKHVIERARAAGVADEHLAMMFPARHHPGSLSEASAAPGSILERNATERHPNSAHRITRASSEGDVRHADSHHHPGLTRAHTWSAGMSVGPAFFLAREATEEERGEPEASFDLEAMTTMDIQDSVTGAMRRVKVYNPDVRDSIDNQMRSGRVHCEGVSGYLPVDKSTSKANALAAWARNKEVFDRCGAALEDFEKPNVVVDAILPTISLTTDITIAIPVMLVPTVKLRIQFKGGIGFSSSNLCWSVNFEGGIGASVGIDVLGWELSIVLDLVYGLSLSGKPWADVKDDLSPGDPLLELIFRPKSTTPDRCNTKTPFGLIQEFFSRRKLLQDLKDASADHGVESLGQKAAAQAQGLSYWKALGEFQIYFTAFVRASKRPDYSRLDYNLCRSCGSKCGSPTDDKCKFCQRGSGGKCVSVVRSTFWEPYRGRTNSYLAEHYGEFDRHITFRKGGTDSNPLANTANIRGQKPIVGDEPVDHGEVEDPLLVDVSHLLSEAAVRLYTPLNRMLKQIPAYANQLMTLALFDSTPRTTLSAQERRGLDGNHLSRWIDLTRDERGQGDVINIARIVKHAPPEMKTVLFWKRIAMSTGNLFTRVVRDLVAIFGGNFANDKDWDGTCISLTPRLAMDSWTVTDGFGPGTAEKPKKHKFAVDTDFWKAPEKTDNINKQNGQASRGVPLWKEIKTTPPGHCCCEDLTPDTHKNQSEADIVVLKNLQCESSSWFKRKFRSNKHSLRFIMGRYLCCKPATDSCADHSAHVYTLPGETCAAEYYWDNVKKLKANDLRTKVSGAYYLEAEKTVYPHLWCGLAEHTKRRQVGFGHGYVTNEAARGFRETVAAMANQEADLQVKVVQSCREVEYHERKITDADKVLWNSLASRWGVYRTVSVKGKNKVRYVRHGWLKYAHGGYVERRAGAGTVMTEGEIDAHPDFRCVWRTVTARSDCEDVVVPKTFVRIFPTLAAMINQYLLTIERLLLNINICLGESLDAKNLASFMVVPAWLDDFGLKVAAEARGCNADGPQGAEGLLYVKNQALEVLSVLRKFVILLGARDPDPTNQDTSEAGVSVSEAELLTQTEPLGTADNTDADFEASMFAPLVHSMATDFSEVLGVEPTVQTLVKNHLVAADGSRTYPFSEAHYRTGLGVNVFERDVFLRGAFWRALLRDEELHGKLLHVQEDAANFLALNAMANEVSNIHTPMQWTHSFKVVLTAGSSETNVDVFCAWSWNYKSWKLSTKSKSWCCSGGIKVLTHSTMRTQYCREHASSSAKSTRAVTKSSSIGYNLASQSGSVFDMIGKNVFAQVATGISGGFVPLSVIMVPPGGYGVVMGKNSTDKKTTLLKQLYAKGPLLTFLSALPYEGIWQGLSTMASSSFDKTSIVDSLKGMRFLTEPDASPTPRYSPGFTVGLSIGHKSAEKQLTISGKTYTAAETNLDVALSVSGTLKIVPGELVTANAEVKLKFDLSPWLDKLWMYKVWQQHQARVAKCYECLKEGKGYCNREPLLGLHSVIAARDNNCVTPTSTAARECQDTGGEEADRITADGERISSVPQWFQFTATPAPHTRMDCAAMAPPVYDLGFSHNNRR